MPFLIENYDQNHLEGLTARYNAEPAFEPHLAPLTPERFVELVARKSYFDPTGLFVAREGGEVMGWVHACRAPGSEPWHDGERKVARLHMLIYPRDRLDVGRALVTAATTWLRERDSGPLEAMHAESGYPFYRGLWLAGLAFALLPVAGAFAFGALAARIESTSVPWLLGAVFAIWFLPGIIPALLANSLLYRRVRRMVQRAEASTGSAAQVASLLARNRPTSITEIERASCRERV